MKSENQRFANIIVIMNQPIAEQFQQREFEGLVLGAARNGTISGGIGRSQ